LRQQVQDALIDQVDQAGSFEVSRFDLNDTELATILDEADAFSFFADKRVVLIDNAQILVSSSKVKVDDQDQIESNNVTSDILGTIGIKY